MCVRIYMCDCVCEGIEGEGECEGGGWTLLNHFATI